MNLTAIGPPGVRQYPTQRPRRSAQSAAATAASIGGLACSLLTGADRRSSPVRIVDSELLSPLHDIVQQHRPSHRAYATGHRRDPARRLVHAAVKITDKAVDGPGDADVDADRSHLDHVSGEQTRPTCRGDHDVRGAGVGRQIDGAGMAQDHGRILALSGQQQAERPANGGASANYTYVGTTELDSVAAQQLDDASRRARQRTRRT